LEPEGTPEPLTDPGVGLLLEPACEPTRSRTRRVALVATGCLAFSFGAVGSVSLSHAFVRPVVSGSTHRAPTVLPPGPTTFFGSLAVPRSSRLALGSQLTPTVVPLVRRPIEEVDADAKGPPWREDDGQRVTAMVVERRAGLGLTPRAAAAVGDLTGAQVEALWRFVDKAVIHLGTEVGPTHLRTIGDVLRARGAVKVKVSHHRVDLLDVASIILAISDDQLRFVRAVRPQKVILLATQDAITRINTGTYYPRKRDRPTLEAAP